jgi:hypothetical protein
LVALKTFGHKKRVIWAEREFMIEEMLSLPLLYVEYFTVIVAPLKRAGEFGLNGHTFCE